MGKNPAFQFYPNDWIRDLSAHPLEIEGAWIRIICMAWWSEKPGEITHSIDQWARILRVDRDKAIEILRHISVTGVGNVTPEVTEKNVTGDTKVTVISRRMLRDVKERINHRLRQSKYRDKLKGDGGVTENGRKSDTQSDGMVTPMSQRSSSSSPSSSPSSPSPLPLSNNEISLTLNSSDEKKIQDIDISQYVKREGKPEEEPKPNWQMADLIAEVVNKHTDREKFANNHPDYPTFVNISKNHTEQEIHEALRNFQDAMQDVKAGKRERIKKPVAFFKSIISKTGEETTIEDVIL